MLEYNYLEKDGKDVRIENIDDFFNSLVESKRCYISSLKGPKDDPLVKLFEGLGKIIIYYRVLQRDGYPERSKDKCRIEVRYDNQKLFILTIEDDGRIREEPYSTHF
jgi:hypothetical protein